MSGACSSVPASAMAMVAMAPGMFLAQRVVPSSGSTAISTLKPPSAPTFSPMNSIGASSISPSPMTTVPSIGSLLSSRRIASTAAWSAAFSSPRPRSRAALTAARSVTRTISNVRIRSRIRLCGTVIEAIGFPSSSRCSRRRLILLDPNDLRSSRDYTVAAHRGERLAHGVLAGGVGDEDDRDRLVGASGSAAALRRNLLVLHDRFQRNLLLRQTTGDGGGTARSIARQQADVIAAFVVLHRRLADRGHACGGAAERRRAHAAGNVGKVGNHRRGGGHAAGAWPDERDRR